MDKCTIEQFLFSGKGNFLFGFYKTEKCLLTTSCVYSKPITIIKTIDPNPNHFNYDVIEDNCMYFRLFEYGTTILFKSKNFTS